MILNDQEKTNNLFEHVRVLLEDKALNLKPKAILLYYLCKFYSRISLDDAKYYWTQLTDISSNLPDELKSELEFLQIVIQPSCPSKGFTSECINKIKIALDNSESNINNTKNILLECENILRKRLLPFGKKPVWFALINAWLKIDRQYVFKIVKKINSNLRMNLIRYINNNKPLTHNEWQELEKNAGLRTVVNISLKILDDLNPQIDLPEDMVLAVSRANLKPIKQINEYTKEEYITESIEKTCKLFFYLIKANRIQLGLKIIKEAYYLIASLAEFSRFWTKRFTGLKMIIEIGLQTKTITNDNIDYFLSKTPEYLDDFVKSHYAAISTTAEKAANDLSSLKKSTSFNQEYLVEAWYLITLIERGLVKTAFQLSNQSEYKNDLNQRLIRALLFNDPKTASKNISIEETEGNPILSLLLKSKTSDRVAYLRDITEKGTKNLPGAMWVQSKEEKGFIEFIFESDETKVDTYLKRNPLYSDYDVNTKTKDQFAVYLRLNGYGKYKYEQIDTILLESLVSWGDQYPEEVRSLLRIMWKAIEPEIELLIVDFLRNAIFNRCITVFSADQNVLISDFLMWLKELFIDKEFFWSSGSKEYRLRLKDTERARMCIQSALAIDKFSPERRDKLIETALSRFEKDPSTVEIAAELYNSNKEIIDLSPPCTLSTELKGAWQTGIIKGFLNKYFL